MEKKKYKYRFTVSTCCYNSAKFIDRIKESLDKQTFRDFEWIVVNDASTDNTSELLQEYIKTVDFPVKFFDLKQNQMIAANINLALPHAEGEIIVGTGHDDIYHPHMLELYDKLFKQYDSDEIAGIIARCVTQYGKITPKEFTKPIMSYWEYGVDKNGRYTGEAPCAFKVDVYKQYLPLDPKELLRPLIPAMMSCDGYKFITTNEIVRTYYVYEEGGSSLTKYSYKYSLWKYRSALRQINLFSPHYHMSPKVKLQLCLHYGYSSILNDIPFKQSIDSVNRYKAMIITLYPLAFVKSVVARNNYLRTLYWKFRKRKNIK